MPRSANRLPLVGDILRFDGDIPVFIATICIKRWEQHGLGERLFERVGEHLQQKGLDSKTKLIHSVVATAANAADCTMLPTCSTAKKHGCGAIRRIAGKVRCCGNTLRTPWTSPTSAIAISTISMKSNERRTAPRAAYAPR
jgi:hypothetical protein